ncbi:hypothetical protein OESDEN_07067 [Oesophagostomum dentatum]|uniref:DUF7083 domain-containing protein n=1 Tax=Oesophagostomum dentatum TaxID=61180 RepID=A0A0B1TA42_OESDE|nr:hypothetical protein OESDEN_07067 [Oesophagostomum dentatum]
MKSLFAGVTPSQKPAIQDASKDQYDQLSKDKLRITHQDSSLSDGKKRDLVLMKLDEEAYRKYADDVLPLQPHEIEFETTVANLQKLFASKKTLIRRRYECLRIVCPPLYLAICHFVSTQTRPRGWMSMLD